MTHDQPWSAIIEAARLVETTPLSSADLAPLIRAVEADVRAQIVADIHEAAARLERSTLDQPHDERTLALSRHAGMLHAAAIARGDA